MVHNGIEYGDMQLICEAYHLLKNVLKMSNEDLAKTFDEWNKGELDSYLIEITAEIFRKKEDDHYVLDVILDTAGQKGTGKWTVTEALEMGMPLTMIGEAVFARCLSAQKEVRVEASKRLPGPHHPPFLGDRKHLIDAVRDAVYASKIVSYTQGYLLMSAAAQQYNWDLNYGGIALMWRGGCIIRSKFLAKIKEAFDNDPNLRNLLLDPYFQDVATKVQGGWRFATSCAVSHGIPLPGITSALSYYDGLRTESLPANLLQAQRDYFGAHTYERVDKPRGQWFHTNWTGRGGNTHSTTYTL